MAAVYSSRMHLTSMPMVRILNTRISDTFYENHVQVLLFARGLIVQRIFGRRVCRRSSQVLLFCVLFYCQFTLLPFVTDARADPDCHLVHGVASVLPRVPCSAQIPR